MYCSRSEYRSTPPLNVSTSATLRAPHLITQIRRCLIRFHRYTENRQILAVSFQRLRQSVYSRSFYSHRCALLRTALQRLQTNEASSRSVDTPLCQLYKSGSQKSGKNKLLLQKSHHLSFRIHLGDASSLQ